MDGLNSRLESYARVSKRRKKKTLEAKEWIVQLVLK